MTRFIEQKNLSLLNFLTECAIILNNTLSCYATFRINNINNTRPCNTGGMSMNLTENQNKFVEMIKFFTLLFGKIPTAHFSYLIKFSGRVDIYSFAINDETQREAMVHKAIELSELGNDVWHAVNPVSVKPIDSKRGDETTVSYQTAIVVDIDIRSDAHKSDNLAADFDEAKLFLPFTPSIIIDSGYGLHAYYIWEEPLAITDDNREEIKQRNNLLIELVRQKANGKKIDGVGDLPRILRTPGTFNYKLGKDNAPLCHIVEINDVRFTPEQFDKKLNALYVEKKPEPKLTHQQDFDFPDDNPDLKEFRIRRMLDYINVVDGEYDKWLDVGFALYNEGMAMADWKQWSRTQPEFKEGECESKWKGFKPNGGITIGTLYQWAVKDGYDEKETQREWYQLHPESATQQKTHASQIDSLKAELRKNTQALADFKTEKKSALEQLSTIKTFDSATVFDEKNITAAAFARLFDKKSFSDLKREIKLFGDKHKEKKASVNDWLADVKDKASEISSRQNDLLVRRNEIQAQINALSFIADNDLLKSFTFPDGYSVSAQNGITKIEGEKAIQVCRRPIVIKAKTYSVEEKKYKVIISYMTTTGRWKNLPATSAAVVANKNKIVDLAEDGLPVTSSNATYMVDFLDAFNAQNESNFPMTYTVPRCGWYRFNDTDYFVDPRHKCSTTDEDKNISVVVEEQSQFAHSLKQIGNMDVWKKAYLLAKPSPVARLIVAASVAPILLKILGERNFLLYICAPTRAGKTTALYLGASAVGSEKMIRSFDATKNGLAGAAADVNDYAFLVDEKQVADNRLAETFDTLVYALANGLGRTKLNKDSTLRKLADWRTIAIMTGETQLLADNVTGGANTRLLTVCTTKEILSATDCKEIRNIIKDNNGLAFPLVINKIFELGSDKLREVYNNVVDTFTENYPELLNEYCRYMAIIVLADTLLNSALGINTVKLATGKTIKAIDDAKLNAREIFKLLPTTVELSDTARERVFVLGFIAQNQNRFIGGNVEVDKMQMIYGKFAEDYIYITVVALKKACADEGFNYRKLVSDLVEDGFFVPSETIKRGYRKPLATVQKKIGKANADCYRIKRAAFDATE